MQLTQLLANYRLSQDAQKQIDAYTDCSLSDCVDDSRKLGAGDLFLAFPGSSSDGRDYFAQAIAAKVAAIIYQSPAQSELTSKQAYFAGFAKQCAGLGIAFIALEDLSAKVGSLAARFYDNPASKMTVIGITGTNGKTSVSTWVAESLTSLGKCCAIMGTLGVGFPGELEATGLTTTSAVATQKHLFDLYQQGAKYVAMEVSSHALDQGRVQQVPFKIAVLTQLGSDHLDYHINMQNYAAAKAKLFAFKSVQHMVLNMGDDFGRQLYKTYAAKQGGVITSYALLSCADDAAAFDAAAGADITAKRTPKKQLLDSGEYTTSVLFSSKQGEKELSIKAVGDFNVENLLAVLGVLLCCGIGWDNSLRVLADLQSPPGRMQCLSAADKPLVVIDYAHTAAALEKSLQAVRPLTLGELFVVFGCGGHRDKDKRPRMAQAACANADVVIFTNDNPRGEPAEFIIKDMQRGVSEQDQSKVSVCYDRAQAIIKTIAAASSNDVVLIAGKGAETTQDLGVELIDFSDIEIVERCLADN